jgi:hypothetical protein
MITLIPDNPVTNVLDGLVTVAKVIAVGALDGMPGLNRSQIAYGLQEPICGRLDRPPADGSGVGHELIHHFPLLNHQGERVGNGGILHMAR